MLNLSEELKIPKKCQEDPFYGPSKRRGKERALVVLTILRAFIAHQVLFTTLPQPLEVGTIISK